MKCLLFLFILLGLLVGVCSAQTCSLHATIDFPDYNNYHKSNEKFITINHDSIYDYFIRLDYVNDLKDSLYYENLDGLRNDTSALFSFEIYKKNKGGFTQKFEMITGKRRAWKNEYGVMDTGTSIRRPQVIKPRDADGIRLSLAFFFDVRDKGEYVLKGYYHPTCNGKRVTVATNEVYFRIK